MKKLLILILLTAPAAFAQHTGGGGGGGAGLPTPGGSGLCFVSTGSTPGAWAWGSCTGSSSAAFSALTSSTNTTAAMVVGTGASLAASGSGTITATAAPLAGISGLATGVATFLGTPSSANLAAAVTDETGTGALVFGTAPTITLANGTGLPISTGVSGLGSGVATFLATPSSANLLAALTTKTGTGSAVFSISAALTGTPDASGATQFKLPVSASFATLANGEIGYDSTALNWHVWQNGADVLLVPLVAGFVSGHCGQPTSTAGVWQIADTGSACGTGGSTAFSALTGSTNTTAAMVLGTGSSLTVSGSGTNTATALTGTPSITVNAVTATTYNGGALSGTFTGSPTLSGNPSFTGTPTFSNALALGSSTATTQTVGDNTTKIATTAFVLANAATNPMTTLGDDTAGGASGAFARIAGPTAAGVYVKTEIPSGGAATAETYNLTGVKPNPQTGTTYTYLSTDATQDRGNYTTFSNASAIAVTLPQAGSTGFGSNWVNRSCDIGAGTATITPTTSTISYTTGSAYTSGATTLALTTGQCATIYSDNTNYFANVQSSGAGGVTSIATTAPITGGTITTTGTIACATCVTSAASLTNSALMAGAGSQGSQTITTGTGVVTALGVNTGTAGAFIVNGGALGTPSSGTGTNITGIPENNLTGAGAAGTITEGGATFSVTRAGIATANLTAPWVFQNTNSTNNNTSITMGITAPGTSTGQTVLNVNGASTGGDLTDWGAGGTWTAGVLSGQTIVASVLPTGAFQSKGTTAGFVAYTQGSTSAAVAPCNAANTICDQAPTAVTAGVRTLPGALAQGLLVHSGTSSAIQEGYSGDSGHAVKATSQTASISTATLCAATAGTACGQAGQYRITANFWGSGTACSVITVGSVALTLTWTDENAVTHSAIGFPMWDETKGAMETAFYPNTALGTESAGGSWTISTNGAVIQYATTYTACTTGTLTYNVRLTAEPLQ